jgi:hypothetical protein
MDESARKVIIALREAYILGAEHSSSTPQSRERKPLSEEELMQELSLMNSLIDQIGRDNTALTRGAVKIRLASQIQRLLSASQSPQPVDEEEIIKILDEIIEQEYPDVITGRFIINMLQKHNYSIAKT